VQKSGAKVLGGEGDEFAAGVFVSLDDLALLDLPAGSVIMGPEVIRVAAGLWSP
jgi:hypothetical protein